MGLLEFFKKIEPDKKKSPYLHTTYDAFFTFLFSPDSVTKGGVHIRDGMDLKRTMVLVVIAPETGSWLNKTIADFHCGQCSGIRY